MQKLAKPQKVIAKLQEENAHIAHEKHAAEDLASRFQARMGRFRKYVQEIK